MTTGRRVVAGVDSRQCSGRKRDRGLTTFAKENSGRVNVKGHGSNEKEKQLKKKSVQLGIRRKVIVNFRKKQFLVRKSLVVLPQSRGLKKECRKTRRGAMKGVT